MIPTRKIKWFSRWFCRQLEKRIQRSFDGVHLQGYDRLLETAQDHPILVVANHTSFWDPTVAIYLIEYLSPIDGYCLMEAENMRRLPFLGRVGAFGVDTSDPQDGTVALAYGAGLLDRPGRLVWIYPQGKHLPIFAPLEFQPGGAMIAARARGDVRVIACATRYEFRGEERPHMYVSFSEPFAADRKLRLGVQEQQRAVAAELARIEQALLDPDGDHGFVQHWQGKPPTVGAAMERLLAWLVRYRPAEKLLPAKPPESPS